MLKHVPNTLTIIRFLLIPFIVACIFNGNFIAAFIIYAVMSAFLVMFVNRVFHVSEEYCKLIVTPVMLVVNFLMNKFWVFKEEKS